MLLHDIQDLQVVLVHSCWTMFNVLEVNSDSLIVQLVQLEPTIVVVMKMLELDVLELLVSKELSEFKEALTDGDVWKYAAIMSGAQFVMTFGMQMMHKLSADNWDFQ